MSWRASGYVKTLTGMTHTEKLVLMILGDYFDESLQYAWPSISRLAGEAMLTERSTIRILQQLEAKGLLAIERGGGRESNHYRFPDLRGDTVSPPPHGF